MWARVTGDVSFPLSPSDIAISPKEFAAALINVLESTCSRELESFTWLTEELRGDREIRLACEDLNNHLHILEVLDGHLANQWQQVKPK